MNQTVVETIEDLIWSLIEDGCSIGIRVCERKLPQPIWKFLYAVGYDLEDEGVHRCLYNFFTDEPRDIEYDVDIDKYETPVSVHNLIADITRHA